MLQFTQQQKQDLLGKAVALATKMIGTHEMPHFSNAGPDVERYQESVGLSRGAPWCMAFVYYIFKSVGYTDVNGIQILIPTGSCQAQADHARIIGLLVSADDAANVLAPGWVMLQWHPELGRFAHCGIVTRIGGDGDFFTVEGNSTNDPAQREGDAVCAQHRNIHDCRAGRSRYAFIQMA